MKTRRNALFIVLLFLCTVLAYGCSKKLKPIVHAEDLSTIRICAHYPGYTEEINYWDSGEGIFYYFLPSGIGPEDLTAETENSITLRLKDEPESDRKTYKTDDPFRKLQLGQTYLLGCYDLNNYLYEVPVIFMKSENVSSIHIHTQGHSYASMLLDKDLKLSGSMLMADENGEVIYRGELDHVKGRGNGSWFSFKKPFNIKLSEPADLLGSGMSRKYSLLNQEMDPSAIRNKLGFELAEASGLAYTPNAEYADLWLDGDYQGLYLLTDRIHVGEAGVDIEDLEAKTAEINPKALKDYPVITNPGMRYSDIPYNPDDITGGYLLEVDTYYPDQKNAWFNTHKVYSVTLKSPSYASREQVDYIHKLVQEMELRIADTQAEDGYKNYIDEDSWARMILLQELMVNSDYMGSSQFFYKKPGDKLIYASPVWDLDQTMGPDTRSYHPYNTILSLSFAWVQDLCRNPHFNEVLHNVYDEAFKATVHEMIDSRIDELSQMLIPAQTMNYTRWKAVAVANHGSERPWEENTENLKSYFKKRVEFIEDLTANPKDYHTLMYTRTRITPIHPYPFYRYCFVKHGFTCDPPLTPSEKDGYRFVQWRTGNPYYPEDPFDFSTPVTEELMVFAEYAPITPIQTEPAVPAETAP